MLKISRSVNNIRLRALNLFKFNFGFFSKTYYKNRKKATYNSYDNSDSKYDEENHIKNYAKISKKNYKDQNFTDEGFIESFKNSLKNKDVEQDFSFDLLQKIFGNEKNYYKILYSWTSQNELIIKSKYFGSYSVSKKIVFKNKSNGSLILEFHYKNESEYSKKINFDILKELHNLGILKNFISKYFQKECFQAFSEAIQKKDYDFIKELLKLENFKIERLNAFYREILECLDIEVIEKVCQIMYENAALQNSIFVSEKDMKYFSLKTFLINVELGTAIVESTKIRKASVDMVLDSHSSSICTFRLGEFRSNRYSINLLPDSVNSALKNDTKIQSEDYVLIQEKDNPDQKYLGEIISIDEFFKTRIGVRRNLTPGKEYTIKKLTTSIPTDVYFNNLSTMCTKNHAICENLRKLIIHSKFPDEESQNEINWETLANEQIEIPNDENEERETLNNDQLTPAQRRAVSNAKYQRLSLIQGPPGTGKTKVAAEIVKEWFNMQKNKEKSHPILVTADSNIAVDNIFKELVKMQLRPLRIGSNSNAEQFFGTKNFHGILKQNPNLVKIVCATCVGTDADSIKKLKFEKVLIDEAGQSTEIANIISLIKNTKQLVIIGDQKQLPPVSFSKLALKYGYSISLFERLIKIGIKPILLDVQYRMHPSIAYFPSTTFYDGLIKNGVTNQDKILEPCEFVFPNKDIPIVFISVHSPEERRNSSYCNMGEIETVSEILSQLLKNKSLKQKQVGIITPYSLQ
jgi:hypothetical protein